MGLIRYEDGTNPKRPIGFVDAKTGDLVPDEEVQSRFKKEIEEGVGIRVTDTTVQNFDPQGAVVFGDVVLESPLTFPVSSREEGEATRRQYPTARLSESEPSTSNPPPVRSMISGNEPLRG